MSTMARLAAILHCEESEVEETVVSVVGELTTAERERDEFEEESNEFSNVANDLEDTLSNVEYDIDGFVKQLDNFNDYGELGSYESQERLLEDVTQSLRLLSESIHKELNDPKL